jgi:hypothetical protein
MTSCPRCDRRVRDDAVSCPQCGYQLKAFGHPGIPLHRVEKDRDSLCPSCLYHHDDTCNFPQRPHAESCILYHNVEEPLTEAVPKRKLAPWYKRNPALVALLVIIAVSVILAIS